MWEKAEYDFEQQQKISCEIKFMAENKNVINVRAYHFCLVYTKPTTDIFNFMELVLHIHI